MEKDDLITEVIRLRSEVSTLTLTVSTLRDTLQQVFRDIFKPTTYPPPRCRQSQVVRQECVREGGGV